MGDYGTRWPHGVNIPDRGTANDSTAELNFGDAGDVSIYWDGTYLQMIPLADDTLLKIGNGTLSMDLEWFGASNAAYLYADASANLLYTVGVDVQFKDNDYLVFGTGSGATGDINFVWNETNFLMQTPAASAAWLIGAASHLINTTLTGTLTVGVDDTGHDVKFFGATTGKYFLWDESADTAIVSGVIQVGTAATAALALGLGVSATPLTTAAADKNFFSSYTQSTATSGDSRGVYVKHLLGGTIAATGYGDAVRALCSVTGTGYSYASGVHATMSLAASATVTGSGAGLRCTLEAAAQARTLPGNIAALQIDSNIGANNTVPSNAAMIRLDKAGTIDVTTFLHIADDQCLKGSAATGSPSDALTVLMPDGTTRYISLIAAS